MDTAKLLRADDAPDSLQLAGHVVGLLLVAAATATGLFIAREWGNGPVLLLYILPVLAAASYWGLWPALLAAVASTLAFNFYFTAPYHTFLIHSATDIMTVAVLFIVALVTSRLAGGLREQARLAAAHAARNATVAGFARRLLASGSQQDIADVAVAQLSQLFGCNAVLLTKADDPQLLASAPPRLALAPSDLAAAATTLDTGEATGRGVRRAHLADWQFRPVASDKDVTATVGLARDDGAPPVAEHQLPLLDSLLDQIALALERARLDLEARHVATLRERDQLRTALLSSIGEDVKPRLGAIAAATRSLKRAGAADKTILAEVAAEVSKLDRYIDNLVDVRPGSDPEPIVAGPVTIDLYRRSVQVRGAEVHLTPKEYAVLAELARHVGRVLTHAHLLRAVWGPAQEDQIDYLRVAIRALRQKLEADPSQPTLIVNEPAVGYRLVA